MSLGKVKFEDGREVELVEVLDDVIVIEKAGKDGEVKRYRLKKTSEMYESVADQVDALVKGVKKKAPKPAEVDELDEGEEEIAAKPAKKTGSVKGSGKAKDDADDEDEAPKETKKGKKASKPVEPEDDEVADDDEEEEAPKAKKAVKAEKASAA